MRLTLRTLLAYLDDVLEPAQTKEIGQKIQESPVAAALVSRVREVIRRRRLAAPDVQGPGQGIDPNIVAQYLDNTLPADRVADVERVCLESDMHLAEVAACHEILSLVLGEPVEVPQTQRDRFYALGPVTRDSRLTEPAREGRTPPSSPAAQPALAPERSFQEGLPDYLKPTPWPRRVAPVIGFVLLLAAAVLALALDPTLSRTLTGMPAREADPGAPPVEQVAGGPASPVAAKPGTGKPGATGTPGAEKEPVATAAQNPVVAALPDGLDPAPPADLPEPAVATTVPMVPPAAAANALQTAMPEPASAVAVATAATALPMATTPAAPMPAATAPPAQQPMPEPEDRIYVPMQYTSTDGILLRYQAVDQHWYVQPRRSELHPEEVFASPEPFEAVLELDQVKFVVTLLSDTVVQILPPTKAFRVRLQLQKGRMIVSRGPGAPADQPVSMELDAGAEICSLELAAPNTTVAVERELVVPTGLPLPSKAGQARTAVMVADGTATLAVANGAAKAIPAGQVQWLSLPPGGAAPEMFALPDWINPDQRQVSAALRRYTTLFEREFDPAAAADLSVPALISDPRPKISELATRCLGTTGSIIELTHALVRSEHPESRAAAARGIRAWLVQDPARSDELKARLKTLYAGDESTAVWRLLIGFGPKDAEDRMTSLQLVDLLRSNFVEIRELAIDQMERLTGRRYDFRPLGSPSQREPGIQRWLAHIERDGALVKPAAE